MPPVFTQAEAPYAKRQQVVSVMFPNGPVLRKQLALFQERKIKPRQAGVTLAVR